jgi:hypothetical protein
VSLIKDFERRVMEKGTEQTQRFLFTYGTRLPPLAPEATHHFLELRLTMLSRARCRERILAACRSATC